MVHRYPSEIRPHFQLRKADCPAVSMSMCTSLLAEVTTSILPHRFLLLSSFTIAPRVCRMPCNSWSGP